MSIRPVVGAVTASLILIGTAACATDEPAGGDAAAVPNETISVDHAQGTTELAGTPETVLTFDLAALTVLDELGIDVAGVPKANLTEGLQAYAGDDVLDIGTLFEPDYEAVAAAAPDLIIVAGRSAAAYPELAEIAPTVDLSNDWADFRTSVEDGATTLGEIFDAADEVAAMNDELDQTIETVATTAADAGTGLIVLTSAGEVTAYGPGSRFGFLHDELAMEPAVEDVEAATHGDPVSFEFILESDPDWLFVVDRDAAVGEGTGNAEAILDNEIVHQTSAWKNDQVVYVDPANWYIVNGGVPTLQGIAIEVGQALGADV